MIIVTASTPFETAWISSHLVRPRPAAIGKFTALQASLVLYRYSFSIVASEKQMLPTGQPCYWKILDRPLFSSLDVVERTGDRG